MKINCSAFSIVDTSKDGLDWHSWVLKIYGNPLKLPLQWQALDHTKTMNVFPWFGETREKKKSL